MRNTANLVSPADLHSSGEEGNLEESLEEESDPYPADDLLGTYFAYAVLVFPNGFNYCIRSPSVVVGRDRRLKLPPDLSYESPDAASQPDQQTQQGSLEEPDRQRSERRESQGVDEPPQGEQAQHTLGYNPSSNGSDTDSYTEAKYRHDLTSAGEPYCPIFADNTDIRAISKEHLRVYHDEGYWNVQVLGRNGLYVNSDFLKFEGIAQIAHGTKIGLKGVEIEFREWTVGNTPGHSSGEDEEVDFSTSQSFSTSKTSQSPRLSETEPLQQSLAPAVAASHRSKHRREIIEQEDEDLESEKEIDSDEDEEDEDEDEDEDEEEEQQGRMTTRKTNKRRIKPPAKPVRKKDLKLKLSSAARKAPKKKTLEAQEETAKPSAKKPAGKKPSDGDALSGHLLQLSEPPKRKGPGRPPTGKYSKREVREKVKAVREQAEAEGKDPEPLVQAVKQAMTGSGEVGIEAALEQAEAAVSKKTTKKRKRSDDLEDGAVDGVPVASTKPAKKKQEVEKAPRSPSPKREQFTEEQLRKPTDKSYAGMIWEVLKEKSEPLSLPDIYAGIKRKWPHYRFEKQTAGWESSVRHTVSQHFFEKAGKAGKGFKFTINPAAGEPAPKIRGGTNLATAQTFKRNTVNPSNTSAPNQQQQPGYPPRPTLPLAGMAQPGNMMPMRNNNWQGPPPQMQNGLRMASNPSPWFRPGGMPPLTQPNGLTAQPGVQNPQPQMGQQNMNLPNPYSNRSVPVQSRPHGTTTPMPPAGPSASNAPSQTISRPNGNLSTQPSASNPRPISNQSQDSQANNPQPSKSPFHPSAQSSASQASPPSTFNQGDRPLLGPNPAARNSASTPVQNRAPPMQTTASQQPRSSVPISELTELEQLRRGQEPSFLIDFQKHMDHVAKSAVEKERSRQAIAWLKANGPDKPPRRYIHDMNIASLAEFLVNEVKQRDRNTANGVSNNTTATNTTNQTPNGPFAASGSSATSAANSAAAPAHHQSGTNTGPSSRPVSQGNPATTASLAPSGISSAAVSTGVAPSSAAPAQPNSTANTPKPAQEKTGTASSPLQPPNNDEEKKS